MRFDANDHSLDPAAVGRRVEVRISATEITATVLDRGVPAHARCFARHRTTHLPRPRGGPAGRPNALGGGGQIPPLARYDALFPA